MRFASSGAGLAVLATTCVPSLDHTTSRITAPTVLAVRAEPPEAAPGAGVVRLVALVAGPAGTVVDAPVQWAFCAVPRAPTDATEIPARCLGDDPAVTSIAASGASIAVAVPSDACRTTGPETPPLGATGALARPPDPDGTGGYYLATRLTLGADVAFAWYRLRCARPDVPTDVARAFDARWAPNQNPVLDGVDASPSVSPPGALVTVTARVRPGSAEAYGRIDVRGQAVVDDVERVDVAWASNAGSFATARTALDTATSMSTNTLRLDADAPERAVVWVVVRDGRGGVGFAEAAITVLR